MFLATKQITPSVMDISMRLQRKLHNNIAKAIVVSVPAKSKLAKQE
jgi:hypothetical protein